ncbi:MAG: CpsB/CapC family capsule biosynthesis tyrosine phosphatase [Rikenellaceae bacterium]
MRSFFFKLFAVSCLLLYIALLAAGLLLPLSRMGIRYPIFMRGQDGLDFWMHFLVFLPWMVVAWGLFRSRRDRVTWFVLGLLAVIGLEVAQLWLPDRGFDYLDLVCGLAGLLCSLGLCLLLSSDHKKLLVKSGVLRGLYDVHSHVLSGVDDGARSAADSLSLLKRMRSLGWAGVLATPHVMAQVHQNDEAGLKARFESTLAPHAPDLGLELALGAEYMLDERMMTVLRDKTALLSFGDTFVLMELPQGGASLHFRAALDLVAKAPFDLILAHPERYLYLSVDDLRALKDEGIFLQLNLLSLSPYYGKRVQERALALLEAGLFDFVGSDVHTHRMLDAVEHIRLSRKHLKMLRVLVETNESLFKA